jgi:ADP-ribosyl-[dinitrogen reductase] hydrolase
MDIFTEKNRDILEKLFKQHAINLKCGNIFDRSPEPLPNNFDFDRIEGMMLGLAIGDSLGRTTEGKLPGKRRSIYGEIRDYLPTHHTKEKAIGLPSDDTQLAFWTLEQMLEDGGFIPDNVARSFTRDRIFGIGSAVKRFLKNYKSGIPWYESGTKSAGNGALMRIAPMLIPHLESPSADLWVDTAISAMITHNDSGSIAGCVSFVNILWQLLRMDSAPRQEWWLETYVDVAKDLELNKKYRPRGGDFMDYEGPIWRFVEKKVGDAHRRNIPINEAFRSWYSGAYLLETIPCVLLILMKYGDDLEEAIVRAVNDTKDNDTIAAIVGAAVGALHGKKGIPERWISKLSGRTREKDDGKIFEILDTARKFGVTGSPETRINYIPWNHNEKHHDGAFGGAGKKYQLISLKTGKESNCELREQNNEISIIFQNGDVISELLTGFDFFDSFNCLQEKLKKMSIQLKACGQCLYFGFSSMAYQCSEGEAGYCTFPKGLDVGSEGTVDVLGVCDCFELRRKETSTSPFLPA